MSRAQEINALCAAVPGWIGRRFIYEEGRQLVAVQVLDAVVAELGSPELALKTVALPSKTRQAMRPPENGVDSIIAEGIHTRVEGQNSGPQLRLTLEVLDLPGLHTGFPRRFTIGAQVESLMSLSGYLAAYMSAWRLNISEIGVSAVLELAAKGLSHGDFLQAVRGIEHGRQSWLPGIFTGGY